MLDPLPLASDSDSSPARRAAVEWGGGRGRWSLLLSRGVYDKDVEYVRTGTNGPSPLMVRHQDLRPSQLS